MTEYSYNVNKNCIEKNGKFVAYVNVIDTKRIVDLLNEQDERIKELEKALNNFKPIIFKNDGEDLILYSDGDLE